MTTSGGPKVAVVLAGRWGKPMSIDLGGYCDTLARHGYQPVLICCGNDGGEGDFPVIISNLKEWEEESFWRNLGIETAILFSWLKTPRVVIAMKRAGATVVSRCDMDGQASARVFPWATWQVLASSPGSLYGRIRRTKHWLHRVARLSRHEDAALLKTIELSDAVAIECSLAKDNLRRILNYYRRPDLVQKLHVIPHSVSDDIFSIVPRQGERPPRIVCGGRWHDPQKDVWLLAATIEILLKRSTDLQVVIVGNGPTDILGDLSKKYSQVEWKGRLEHDKMAELLAGSRSVLSTSRWEGYSILALEALCMGCTLIGPPLTCFKDMTEGGRFGTVSRRRSAQSLADAVLEEMRVWARGARQPEQISRTWRPRVHNDQVVPALLSLAG